MTGQVGVRHVPAYLATIAEVRNSAADQSGRGEPAADETWNLYRSLLRAADGDDDAMVLDYVDETPENKLDVFGAPRQRPTAGPRSLIPGNISRDLKATDPLRAELDRVGYVLSDKKKPGGETEDQHRLRKRIEGPKLRQNLENMIRSEAYQSLPDRYEQALRRQIPDLPDEAYRAEAEKLARSKQNDMLGDEAERIRRWYTDQIKAIKAFQ